MNEIARNKIKAVLKGKSSNTVEDTSGYSQEPSADNVIHESDETTEETDEYTYDDQYYDESYNEGGTDYTDSSEYDYYEEPSYDNYDEGQ